MRPVTAVPALLLAAAVLAAPARAGEMRHPEDAALHAVQFVDASEGWAVGDEGVVWHTIDAGKEWELVPSHVRASLRSVCFLNPYLGWVAGRDELPDGQSAGVVLFTADGGVTWKRVLLNALPGLNVVRFADEKTGYLAGDGSDQHPSGLFVTTDSGRTWEPVPGPRVASWLAGDFGGGNGGALAGAWDRLGTVRNGKAFTVDMDSLGGRNLCGLRLHGKTGVAVGQGGLLLTTNAAGSSWNFVDAGLPKNVPCDWDFHAVHGVGKQYWVVGRPGSVVLHSADDGAHWEVQRTGQPLPLDGVFFADELHGWAVGELGSILATTDGGKSWKLQRRGGQRAAALFVHARAGGVPLDTVALLGGQEGYVTGTLRVTAADPTGAAPSRCTDGARLSAAVRQAGGAACETLWQFPVASHLAHAGRDDLLHAWDRLHGDRAAEQLLRQMVLALRVWRPDVIVTDSPEAGAADGLVVEALHEAFKDAADPKIFPEQLSIMGLEPWKASKLYGLCTGRTDGQVSIDLTAVSGPLESTLREFASAAAAGLGDDAAPPPAERRYRLLAAFTAGAADHGELMQGVELAHGGLARRPLDATETSPETAKAVHRRAALLALAETPIAGLADPDKLVSRIEPMLHDMPDEQAGNAVFAVADHFAHVGQWDLARETFLMMADRYPAHPRTPEALRWLIRHISSSEARRRSELGQFVAAGQVSFGQPKQAPAPMPAADADKAKGLKLPEFENRETLQMGNIAGMEVVRKWYQGAAELGPRLAAFGPIYAGDPATQFCLQSARRNLGDLDAPKKWYADFVSRQPEGPWRNAAAAELWLMNRGGPPPKAALYCRATDERPFLDGKLDDPCWQAATALPLNNAAGDAAGEYKTEARMTYDREFLYLAVRCARPADRRESPAKPRTHDADLRGHDRVSLLLDLDRNYATCFHFTIDQRGCIADDCWGDKSWDPRWFVAVHNDEAEWVMEAAIPLSALTGDVVTPGRVWCCNVIRTVPGKGVQAWSLPAEAPEETFRPEGMGLLIFTEGKPAATASEASGGR